MRLPGERGDPVDFRDSTGRVARHKQRRRPCPRPEAEQLLRDGIVELPGEPGTLLEDGELTAAFVQARVRQRDRGVGGEEADEPLVVLGEAAGLGLAGREDEAENLLTVPDGNAEHVRELRMRSRPTPEPRIRADVVEPHRLAFAQKDAQQPVLPGQGADGLLLLLRQPRHDELGERPGVVWHAQSRVPGAGQRPCRPHDHLQHIAHRQLTGNREDYLADVLEQLVVAGVCSRVAGRRAGMPRHIPDRTRAGRDPDRANGVGLWSQAGLCRGPMAPEPQPPSVGVMNSSHLAIVTGASRGLGRALAGGLAAAGYQLIIDAREAVALEAAAADLRDRHDLPRNRVLTVPGDITDPAHRADLAAAAAAAGGARLLVNNAGTLGATPLPALADYPLAALRESFEANVIAPVALTQLLLPGLRARGGAVLSITSDAAVEAYSGWGGYGAAKAALEQASNVLAAEEAAVRVWWVDPGDLRTQMHQAAFPGEDISDRPLPDSVVPAFLRLVTERMPSGRYRATDLVPAGVAAGATS